MKICTICNKNHNSNYLKYCIDCYHLKWRIKNKDKHKIIYKKTYEKNKEKCLARCRNYYNANKEKYKKLNKEYSKNHPEINKKKYEKFRLSGKRALIMKRWRKNNPNRNAYDCNLRKVSKINAMPKCLNKEEIKQIYLNRPNGYHVDHIIPLRGKNVCGLHVPWNLQYLTAFENLSKHNRLDTNIKACVILDDITL